MFPRANQLYCRVLYNNNINIEGGQIVLEESWRVFFPGVYIKKKMQPRPLKIWSWRQRPYLTPKEMYFYEEGKIKDSSHCFSKKTPLKEWGKVNSLCHLEALKTFFFSCIPYLLSESWYFLKIFLHVTLTTSLYVDAGWEERGWGAALKCYHSCSFCCEDK